MQAGCLSHDIHGILAKLGSQQQLLGKGGCDTTRKFASYPELPQLSVYWALKGWQLQSAPPTPVGLATKVWLARWFPTSVGNFFRSTEPKQPKIAQNPPTQVVSGRILSLLFNEAPSALRSKPSLCPDLRSNERCCDPTPTPTHPPAIPHVIIQYMGRF